MQAFVFLNGSKDVDDFLEFCLEQTFNQKGKRKITVYSNRVERKAQTPKDRVLCVIK